MKLVKMSLVAAMVVGVTSAFALDNVKVTGDASLFYGTNNAQFTSNSTGLKTNGSLGNKETSFADTAVRLGVTGDLMKGVSFGVTGYYVSTLGLENNLVSNTWTGAHSATANGSQSIGAQVNDASWIAEAWMAATLGKTTAKIGRMELDTPLAFSEKWSIVPNTFEAAVLINQDLPDTTLVGAWVGKGNGTNALHNYAGPVGVDGVVAAAGHFNTYMNDGAYAVAAINNSFKPLTLQVWDYNVVNVANAVWAQADIDCSLVKGLKIGGQYADLNPKGLLGGAAKKSNSNGYAGKLGYEGIENLKVSVAGSKTNKDGVLKIANTATNNLGTAQSKLYTEAYWNYGYVGNAGARSYALAAEYKLAGIATLGAQYTNVNGRAAGLTVDRKLQEAALTASKSFGPLDATLAYFSTKASDQNIKAGNTEGSRYDSVLAMLKLNF